MALFAILKADHDSINDLLRRLSLDSEDTRMPADTHKELLARMRSELSAHLYAKDAVIYPALHDLRLLRDGVDHLKGEQATMESILEELSQPLAAGRNATELLHRLRTLVASHFNEEETEVFPQAEALIDATDDKRLSREYVQKRDMLLHSPTHPLKQVPLNSRMRKDMRQH